MENIKGDGPDFSGPIPQRKRSFLDQAILVVVVVIATVVIGLSFQNTAKLATELNLNPFLTAGLVEMLFASLLFIRGRQRATQRVVPFFLSVGYFASLGFVSAINMWGLATENPTIGPIVGGAISAAMWLMESVLVWLWTASHEPHKKSAKELEREANREIKEIEILQKIEWRKWNAKKPSLDLIKLARREEEKRKAAEAKGMPTYFAQSETILAETIQAADQPADNRDQADQPAAIEQAAERPKPAATQPAHTNRPTAAAKRAGGTKRVEVPAGGVKRAAAKKPAASKPNRRAERAANPTTDKLFEMAAEMYRQEGKPPSRKRLAEAASTTEWQARKGLEKLAEWIEQTEAAADGADQSETKQAKLQLVK